LIWEEQQRRHRLTELSSGTIFIDGQDISKLDLADLRSKLSIIPQDPVLFDGSVRFNLDPFGNYPDHEIWEALEIAQLKEAIQKIQGGLQGQVQPGGANFSVGQRQLFCLARALLRKNKILVMDEATASVDPATDELIQKMIRKHFADCTVLTIAHRLNTIADSDRILVLANGTLAEYDSPPNLLKNPESLYCKLIETTKKEEDDSDDEDEKEEKEVKKEENRIEEKKSSLLSPLTAPSSTESLSSLASPTEATPLKSGITSSHETLNDPSSSSPRS